MTKKKDPNEAPKLCGATKRQGPGICRRPAGWGTNHAGDGRCKLHGGKNTGPKNTEKTKYNGLKHGLYAKPAWYETLTETEKTAYETEEVDTRKQIDDEIRLLGLRERRMMERIKQLVDSGPWTLVGIRTQGYQYYKDLDDFKQAIVERGRMLNIGKREFEEEWTGTLGQIQAVEEALTKVQDKKAKLLDLKHRIEQTAPPTDNKDGLKEYAEALNATAAEVWDDEGGEDNGEE